MPTAENIKPDKSDDMIQPIMDTVNELTSIEYETFKEAISLFLVPILIVITLVKMIKYFKKRM